MLRSQCQPKPSSWNKMQLCAPTPQQHSPWQLMSLTAELVGQRPQRLMLPFLSCLRHFGPRYNIAKNGDNFAGVTAQTFTDYTAEFLLTRGPYAILGYSW